MATNRRSKVSELTRGLSSANASFCSKLFQTLCGSCPSDNLFMSPFSILTVLAIALLGAKDQTASEMISVLSLAGLVDTLPEVFREYMSLMCSAASGCEVSMANKLFVRKDKKICSEFVQKCQLMKTKAELCDFAGNPEGECAKINSWVSKETHEKIQNVISPLLLSKDTSVLVVNAIYFKGMWMNKFSPECTSPGQFKVSSSQHVQVDMMHVTDTFGYKRLEDLKCVALEMPYKGNTLSMVIFLPFEDVELESVVKNLTVEHLKGSNFPQTEVSVALPRFKMESEFELSEPLRQMGLKSAFDPTNANFKGIDPQGLLTLSKVIHKSYVEVNEYGTEAAACTAMDCVDGLLIQEIFFTADHPFLFFIRDNRSDVILFVGKLVNPEGLGTPQPQSDW